MDMSGEQRIPAPQQAVWDALFDPEVLKLCIPGCDSVEKVSDTQFTAKVVIAVGPVKAKFAGEVALEELNAPNNCTINGKGSGGIVIQRCPLFPGNEGQMLGQRGGAEAGEIKPLAPG